MARKKRVKNESSFTNEVLINSYNMKLLRNRKYNVEFDADKIVITNIGGGDVLINGSVLYVTKSISFEDKEDINVYSYSYPTIKVESYKVEVNIVENVTNEDEL